MATNVIRTEALSHGQKVCRLYKRAQRLMQAHCDKDVGRWRYNATVMRARFDKNKAADSEEAKVLLADAEKEVRKLTLVQPLKFPFSPGGSFFGREAVYHDMNLDIWHPLEKAQYPTYFATREIRKREFAEKYANKYGLKDNND